MDCSIFLKRDISMKLGMAILIRSLLISNRLVYGEFKMAAIFKMAATFQMTTFLVEQLSL